jgi:glutathione S-transferase
MTRPILYSGTRNASSWAMRAWLALRAAKFDFDEEIVDIRRPQRFEGLARIGRLSPSASVPVLVTNDATIFDSLAIMEFANDIAAGELLPESISDRAKTRSIVAWQHSGLSRICDRISFESAFYPLKRRLTSIEISECSLLFGFLERVRLASEGPFLFGSISLADFALTPTVVRLSRHNPPMKSFPETEQWMRAVVDHPLVEEWLSEADRLPHIWFDEYLVPGQSWDGAIVEGTSGDAVDG